MNDTQLDDTHLNDYTHPTQSPLSLSPLAVLDLLGSGFGFVIIIGFGFAGAMTHARVNDAKVATGTTADHGRQRHEDPDLL